MYYGFNVSPQYSNMAFHDACDSLVNIRWFLEVFAMRKILKSRCDYVDLTTCMSDEYCRQSTQTGRNRIHGVSTHAVGQIHYFIYRTHLSLIKLTVSWIYEWSDCSIVDLMHSTKWQNRVVNETGDVHRTRADYRQSTTNASVLQHKFAIGAELHLSQYC